MAGTIPIALSQQFATYGDPVSAIVLRGCLLYIFQAGSVSTPQLAFSDTGLTQALSWPVVGDSNGRLPMFYLADGSVHVRLTDAQGIEQFDYPNMLVIGPSSGSSGGGGTVDPTTIAATGDIKFRPTIEVLTGWIKLNGLSIGAAASGASQRANNDTQNLYVYLWTNFPNTKCPVGGGRGGSALADFASNKPISVLDWRDKCLVGLDDMGNTAAGGILASNITSGGGDLPTTPAAFGGEANHVLSALELAPHTHPITDPTHFHSIKGDSVSIGAGGPFGGVINAASGVVGVTEFASTGITATDASSGGNAHNTMQPFTLGTFYMKL